jgi:hypothetical protein
MLILDQDKERIIYTKIFNITDFRAYRWGMQTDNYGIEARYFKGDDELHTIHLGTYSTMEIAEKVLTELFYKCSEELSSGQELTFEMPSEMPEE